MRGFIFSTALLLSGVAPGQEANQPADATVTTPGLAIAIVFERRIVAPAADGVEVKFVPAGTVSVGDELFYTLRVSNTTDKPIADATVVKAIPRNTRYVPDTAVGPAAEVTFSVDGGTSFAAPAELLIATAPDSTRPAVESDYTHIRWRLKHPLAPGATALLRFSGIFR